MSLLQEGQLLHGTYEVERFIGEGAFAEVYRVRHRFLGRQAMKIFKMPGLRNEEVEETLGEAILLSRIGHRNIIRVFDANVLETSSGLRGFFTMEHVAGGNLEKLWRSYGAQFVPVDTAVEVTQQVCRGLAVAHSEDPPIIHRDIKPQNILVGYDATGLCAKLADFGLAKRVNPLTLLASARGTWSFKPPEVFRNPQSDSCAGDVWAVGSTLYLLLTDRLPYADDTRYFDRPLALPSRLNVHADSALDRIVIRALAVKPEERYPTANELLEDLTGWARPARGRSAKRKEGLPATSKGVLGVQHSQPDEENARKMATDALKLGRQALTLREAADLMEEAFNKWPQLRQDYEGKVKLWRRGIVS